MPRKLVNQDRRRGQIIARGPNKFLVRVTLREFTDAEGKKRRDTKAVTVAGTRKDAEAALTALLGKKDAGTLPKTTKATLGECAEAWLAGRLSIAPRTRRNYRDRLDYYVLPAFGTWPMQKVTKPLVQSWLADLATRYSPETVRQAYVVLFQVAAYAVREGVIAANPCADAELPKRADVGGKRVLSPEEMTRFIAATAGDKHGTLWHVLLATGMRPQEAFALTWDDVATFTTSQGTFTSLAVTKALSAVAKRVWEVAPVKTKKGRRAVVLPPAAAEALMAHRGRLEARSPALVATGSLVFPNDDGGTLNPDTVYEAWQRALKRHGLPAMPLYYARHSSITALLAANVHPKIVAERAGHSSTAVTLEVYSHVLPSMQVEAAVQMSKTLSEAP